MSIESKQGQTIDLSELENEFAENNNNAFAELEAEQKISEFEKLQKKTEIKTQAEQIENEENSENEFAESETKTSESISEHITGELAVNLFDVVFSRLFSVGSNMAGMKTDYKDFKLDANEKKSLVKPLDAVIKKYGFSELSPEWQLGIIIISIYGVKFAGAVEKSKERKPKTVESVPRGTNENEGVNYYDIPAPYGRFSNGKPKQKPRK